MIKFFRQIRYNLMSENKTGKYLKYAIGEIVLVVIGILIALSINNWNEKSKMEDKQKVTVLSIIDELEMARIELNKNLEINELILNNISSYLDDSFNETKKNSSAVISLLGHNNTKLDIPLVTNVLNSNELSSLSDKELLKTLRDLNSLNESIGINEAFLDDFWNSKTAEFLIKKKYAYSAFDISGRKGLANNQNYSELYNDDEYKNLIAIKWALHFSWVSDQRRTLKKVDEILNNLRDK